MNDSTLYIHGHGAVSCAGTDAASLYEAVTEGHEFPHETEERSVGDKNYVYSKRPVDLKALKAAMPKHPRLRRSSNVSKFAVTAAHEAIGSERIEKIKNHELRVGIVLNFLNGCVNYSNRFFKEVLEDPAFASPILFPETVFNAPASHIAASLHCDGPVYTVLGDSATWFSGFDIARDWITSGQVDGCLILCSEETDWLTLEGLSLYSKKLIATEGAAAVYVEMNPSDIYLEELNGPFSYHKSDERKSAINNAYFALENSADVTLFDGLTGISRLDHPEQSLSEKWTGPTISPAKNLGEAMGARCGFQTVAAIESVKRTGKNAAILATGGNQHAYSAVISKA